MGNLVQTLRTQHSFTRLSMLAAGLCLTLTLIGCGSKPESGQEPQGSGLQQLTGRVKIDGSSTVFVISEAAAEEFQKETRGKVKVTVGIAGTGGGFKKFARGEIDIADASRPILEAEIKAAKDAGIEFIELPICFDALTVAVHPQNDWVDHLTIAELKKLWEPAAQGKITRWNQLRPQWPDHEIKLFGAGSDSGTFDYFTEAVCGKAKSSRGDFTASEDDNALVSGIAGDKYALGYIPFAYYEPNQSKLKAVPIDWEKDDLGPMLPSLENVVAGKYNPLSRPLFLYVNRSSAERPEIKAFVAYYLQHGRKLVEEVKYLPLPEKAYTVGLERLQKLQTGSAFGGVPEIGISIDELLKREPK